MKQSQRWCTARHRDPDVTCELRYRHDGKHRAEFAPPVLDDDGHPHAQVVTWE